MKSSRSGPVAMGVLATGGALIAGLLMPTASQAAQPVTIDVVVSEMGDVSRFRSSKAVASYAGLVPQVRQSAGKGKASKSQSVRHTPSQW